ncbi:hypothetical protein ACEPAI_9720 [Sanghuangporus weigelae]
MPSSSPDSSVDLAPSAEQSRRRAYKACLHCRSRKAKCDLGDIDAPGQPPCARCKRERRECVFAPSYRGGKIIRRNTDPPADLDKGKVPDARSCTRKNEHKSVTFSASDIDIAEIEEDMNTRSESEGPPRKTMRLDAASSASENAGDRDRVDPQSLAAASLRNPTDALNLLALAADVDRKTKAKRRASVSEANTMDSPKHAHDGTINADLARGSKFKKEDSTSSSCEGHTHLHTHRMSTPPSLNTYALVRDRVLSPATLKHLVEFYFSHAHAVFPMVPHHHIPRCSTELARFAAEEAPLLTAMVVIASRQEKMFDVHARSWEYMQTLINELILGKYASVGAVEALLLLSENLPRRTEAATEDDEHRMAWMLVGMAVRIGYMLGLDQKTLRPISPGVEDSGDRDNDAGTRSENERLDRDRLAWTYCYIFDRSISIRSGKAFWSRGPGLCFQRTHCGAVPSASETFPSLRAIPGTQDDFSAMLQAYTELTQTMASAHDVLYPSKDRTIALVRVGDYHKYLDELTRTFLVLPSQAFWTNGTLQNGFRLNWEGKIWETQIVQECVWLTFHYTRLYIYAFAFQAHVQRNTTTTEDGKKVADNVIFPRGPMGSPDARFILEAIDAATELLHICVERLHPSGAMTYLPWRFFLYFQYAGVFLLKAVFVGAVVPQDQRAIVQLVKKVIVCLACASSDDQQAGVRYARLLNGLLRVFSRGVDGVASQVGTPKRRTLELSASVSTTRSPNIEDSDTIMSKSDAAHAGAEQQVTAAAHASVPSPPVVSASSLTSGPLVNNATSPVVKEAPIHHVHSPATEAVLAHLPMPRLDASVKYSDKSAASHSMQSLHQPISADALFASSHLNARSASRFTGGLSPGPYHRTPAPLDHRTGSRTQGQQLYTPAPSRSVAANGFTGATNGINVNVNGANGGFDLYQVSPTGSASLNLSQFDLNWPPTEVDGLAQMLTDDHALDGDFWMSLPSHVQWQAWPQSNGTPAPPASLMS